MIELQRARKVFFSKQNRKCEENHYMHDFMECFMAELQDDFIRLNFTCVPIHLKSILFPKQVIKVCEDEDEVEIKSYATLVTDKINEYVKWNSSMHCSLPCSYEKFEIQSVPLKNLGKI